MIELAVVAFLAFYEPPKAYNKCATAFFALGTTTIDLVLLAAVRCATYIVIAHRTPPSSKLMIASVLHAASSHRRPVEEGTSTITDPQPKKRG